MNDGFMYILSLLAIVDGLLCLGILLFFLKLYFWSRDLENRIRRIEEFTTSDVLEEAQVAKYKAIQEFHDAIQKSGSIYAYELTMSTFNLKKFDRYR